MGKKGLSKQQKKLEKAIAKREARKAQNGDDAGDHGAGLCPCATRLKPQVLHDAVAAHPLEGWLCHGCLKDGGAQSGNLWVCLTCGHCGCSAHARAHYEEHQTGKKKQLHTLCLPVAEETYCGHYAGKCFECELPVNLKPYDVSCYLDDGDDYGAADSAHSYVQGHAVGFDGYLVDESREFNDAYQECCVAVITKGVLDGAAAASDTGGKRGKAHAKKTQQQQRKLLAAGRKGQQRGKAAAAGWHAKGRRQQHAGRETRLEHGAREAGLVGLQNFGNTCYFNAAVQAMAATPTLQRELQAMYDAYVGAAPDGRKIHAVTAAACALFLKMGQGGGGGNGGAGPQLKGLLAEVRRTGPQFQGFDQHDSQELLRHLTDTIAVEFATGTKAGPGETPRDPFAAVFAGGLASNVRCGSCSQVSATPEVFYDLSVPVRKSLVEALTSFFEEEPLEDCRYPCPSCNKAAHAAFVQRQAQERQAAIDRMLQRAAGAPATSLADLLGARDDSGGEEEVEEDEECGDDSDPNDETSSPGSPPPSPKPVAHVDPQPQLAPPPEAPAAKLYTTALKQYAITTPPRTLVVHLKRFKFCRRVLNFVKDTTTVDVPEFMSLDAFIKRTEGSGDSAASSRYRLYACVEHKGEVGFGHYVAHVRANDKWYECDDGWVHSSSLGHATKAPYILLYAAC
eukprot:TRINITY_DN6427_c1_g2_i1.p1 TRINITY_DN6427_c1_g2~~TRINITY_DN6427_c1_g2_i1.p1  ORF type:complete len:680 (+),score=200.73 TRINITY_DN6427_c1_g2_i1:77-2116(+)